MKLIPIFSFLLTFVVYPIHAKTVMLVLGSANSKTLESRTAVAVKLYHSRPIDKIIVSGGCGAHGSAICEASVMYQGLISQGVEAHKIYKEENAKTTVQNYVFSRILKDEKGDKIIQPGDTVFVVSDHWHAISVAARLSKYDQVDARFFIEGAIAPKENDKLDYVSIFNGEPSNDNFIRKALWLTPDVVWWKDDLTYYLMQGQVYAVGKDNKVTNQLQAETLFNLDFMKDSPQDFVFVDVEKHWLVRQGDYFHKIDKKDHTNAGKIYWDHIFINFPIKWRTQGFNTGVLVGDKLYLFANDAVLSAKKRKGKFYYEKEGVASDFVKDWPFSWGASNVSSAVFNTLENHLYLHRNRELLKLNKELQILEKPSQVNINWIGNNK